MTMRCAVLVAAVVQLSCCIGVRGFCFGGTVPLIDGSTYRVSDNGAFAASNSDSGYPPFDARLSSGEAWCSMDNLGKTDQPWIQVTFDKVFEIHRIGVAGHDVIWPFSNEVIVNYHVRYGMTNDQPLSIVLEENGTHPMVFSRGPNVDEVKSDLPSPIFARVLRIEPLPGSWLSASRACVRFEAYGCPAPVVVPVTPTSSSIAPSTTSIALSPTMINDEEVSTVMVTETHVQSSSNTPTQSLASTTSTLAGPGTVVTNTVVLFESDITQAPLLTTPVLGILIGAVILVIIAVTLVLMLACLMVVCCRRSKKYTRERLSTQVKVDNSVYESSGTVKDQVNRNVSLEAAYSKLDRGSLNIMGLSDSKPHNGRQDQVHHIHKSCEDDQKQYDYVTTPPHIPVAQVPHQPPLPPHRMGDKPLTTVDNTTCKQEHEEVPNPVYNSIDEHTKTGTNSTCAEKDLVYNPMYGQSHT